MCYRRYTKIFFSSPPYVRSPLPFHQFNHYDNIIWYYIILCYKKYNTKQCFSLTLSVSRCMYDYFFPRWIGRVLQDASIKKKLELARITVGDSVGRMVGGGWVGAGIDSISTTRFAFNFCTPLTVYILLFCIFYVEFCRHCNHWFAFTNVKCLSAIIEHYI